MQRLLYIFHHISLSLSLILPFSLSLSLSHTHACTHARTYIRTNFSHAVFLSSGHNRSGRSRRPFRLRVRLVTPFSFTFTVSTVQNTTTPTNHGRSSSTGTLGAGRLVKMMWTIYSHYNSLTSAWHALSIPGPSVRTASPSCSILHSMFKSNSSGSESVICDSTQHTTWVA